MAPGLIIFLVGPKVSFFSRKPARRLAEAARFATRGALDAVAVLRVGDSPPRRLLRVSPSHLALVCGKCSQNLLLLPLGHLEEVKRSPKFSRDFVELGGRDL